MGSVNIGGLVSGIDTDTIIDGLMQIQQKQLDLYNSRKTTAETKKTAYQSLQTQLLSLRTTATTLSSPTNNPFDSRVVTVSDSSAVVATAASKSQTGTYQIKVNTLASAHTVGSQSFSNPDSAITHGTFKIHSGSQAEAEITVDSSNDTLSGLADSINFANVGVSASIVQDGNNSYRLLLTASKTGEINSISVSNDLAASDGNAIQPTFDFDNPVQAAQDASVTLGSGGGALTVTNSSNTVTNLITGVTLNLLTADPGKTLSISVGVDTEKADKAVNDYVTAYNAFLDFVDEITKYDADSDTGAALQGEYSALSVRNQVQQAVQGIIPNVSALANRLSAIGVTTSDSGRLTVNDAQLQEIISGSKSGVGSADLRKLFSLDGTTSTGGISFVYAGAKTNDSTTPYQVNVTQAAERAGVSGATALADSTTIDETNNLLKVNLDGVEATVTLSSGTYTRDELANAVETAINNNSAFSARSVSIGVNSSQKLTVTSDSYGDSSRVTFYDSPAVSALGFNGGESDVGVDVAGEFIVNGKVEKATGAGRVLTGAEGNTNTDGLQVRVTLSTSQISSGVEGTVTVSRGIASRMNAAIDRMLNSQTGMLVQIDNRMNEQIESIQKQIDQTQAIFDQQKDSLTSRFTAMETALQKLQSTSSLLGSQLASISNISKSS